MSHGQSTSIPHNCSFGVRRENLTAADALASDDDGFVNAGESHLALTPAFLAVMTEATNFISTLVAQSLAQEHPTLLNQAIVTAFDTVHGSPKRTVPWRLTPDQLGAMRAAALGRARELNLSEAEAESLVDAVIGTGDK